MARRIPAALRGITQHTNHELPRVLRRRRYRLVVLIILAGMRRRRCRCQHLAPLPQHRGPVHQTLLQLFFRQVLLVSILVPAAEGKGLG